VFDCIVTGLVQSNTSTGKEWKHSKDLAKPRGFQTCSKHEPIIGHDWLCWTKLQK